jgi:hypothetical protein
LKVAVTDSAAATVTLQAAIPVHAPLQPVKVLPVTGVSLSVTWVFCGKLAEHVVGQLIPAGLLIMVPVPVPAIATVNPSPGLNVALTLAAAVRVRLQVLVPEQPPLHPPKK